MNKSLLSPVLIALISTQVNAADPVLPNNAAKETTTSTITAPPPAPQTTQMPTTAPVLDCNFHIPASQTAIDSAMITAWGEKAAIQSFTFTPANIQTQLETLNACFTEQGWKSFNDALQKSGNVESIKNQQLNVSAQSDGAPNISTVKEGQWKVTLPLQVVYQNDKEKVTQHLYVALLIGRKPSGDLGIMQLVATAKPDEVVPAGDKPAGAPAPTEQKPANEPPTPMPTTTPSPNDTPAGPAAPNQPVQPTTPNPAP